jgi:hypothetical protein
MLTRLVLICAALVAAPSIARADLELKNDGFVSGGQATFQTGFVSGEGAGVRFMAPSAGRQLTKVQLLFGGAMTSQTMTIKVLDDSAGTDTPGNELYMGDVELTGADNAMQELDLRSANVYVPQQFRVVFLFNHAGAPTLATDGDGIHAGNNFIYSTTWKTSSSLGVAGDWIVRAFVTDSPDAGPTNSFCDTNAECGNGRYCDTAHHVCTFDCQGDTDCPSGGHCDQDVGQCGAGAANDDDGGCRTGTGGAGGLVMLALLALLLGARKRR